MSDSSSEGSRDAFVSEGGISLSGEDTLVSSPSVPSLDASDSAHKIVEDARCIGSDDCTCHNESLEAIVHARREAGVRKASRDATFERRNSFRSVVMVWEFCVCVGSVEWVMVCVGRGEGGVSGAW
jgi:hypothetical protein